MTSYNLFPYLDVSIKASKLNSYARKITEILAQAAAASSHCWNEFSAVILWIPYDWQYWLCHQINNIEAFSIQQHQRILDRNVFLYGISVCQVACDE